ncbi:MAG: glycosyltransferase [Ignavibacteriales bacterium]|nr:glycosyltransferase [Ignavibacteriales bacterium]
MTPSPDTNKSTKTRLLYIGLKYDYGKPELGFSYEYFNLYNSLIRSENYQVDFFPFDEIMRDIGRDNMNKRLIETVHELKPDCCFFVLFTDEIKKETIQTITEKSGSITFNWFGDDHWRFENYSKHWAPLFDWISTTDSLSVDMYQRIGCKNVIKTQWGFNHHLYKNHDVVKEHDVTFIGQSHSNRKRILHQLEKNGLNIKCWGKGWENGRLNHEDMVKMFSRSKINLNFTESSIVFDWKPITKVFINRRADDSLHFNSPLQMLRNIKVLTGKRRHQIKGRNFEIPGSGGFLLTQYADNLDEYFIPGKEIAVFSDTNDLKDKIKYYLSNDEERENIRQAGFQRALRDHTYEKRFVDIFSKIGLLTNL